MAEAVWKLNEAKTHFSKVVKQALSEGPQTITRYGEEVVIILSIAEYNRLQMPQDSLVDFFRNSPLVGINFDLERKPG
jgi:antitoxin Phd